MNSYGWVQNKLQLFWLLQMAGWSGWAVSFYLGVIMWGEPPPYYAIYLSAVAGIGIGISLVLRALYRHMWEMEITRRIVAIIAGSYAAGLVWMATRASLFQHLYAEHSKFVEREGMELLSYFDGAVSAFWVMLVWSALYFGIKNYILAQTDKERVLKALSMAHEAQLKMLRYQLNPHFLFNTLNAISTLILDKNNKLANVMVTRLSRFLRYTLDNDPMQKVSVTEEVEALRLYLDIEAVRFDERLALHINVEDAVRDALMPSLLLQPLVENSIKYAIAQSVNGGYISIEAYSAKGRLCLQVSDDGPWLSAATPDQSDGREPRQGGVGIANCKERLKEIYGVEHSFELGQTDPHGLTVTICIPLEFGSRAS